MLSTMLLHIIIALFFLSAVHSQKQQECPHATGLNRSEIEVTSRKFLQVLDKYRSNPSDIVFVLDSSDSVDPGIFSCQVQFVRDVSKVFTVSADNSRIAVITYSGCYQISVDVDYIGFPTGKNKCTLLEDDLLAVHYREGSTCTVRHGGLLGAQLAFERSRYSVPKLVFMLMNSQTTGGRVVNLVASSMKARLGVTIFVIALGSGGTGLDHITNIASTPKADHVFFVHLLSDVATLAIGDGDGLALWDRDVNSVSCDSMCSQGHDCCDSRATCSCATQTGSYGCACHPGYTVGGQEGGECEACPTGTYKPKHGNQACTTCPVLSTTTGEGGDALDACECLTGHEGSPKAGVPCKPVSCDRINASSGLFPTDCGYQYGTVCRLQCKEDYLPQPGTAERVECLATGQWSANSLKCIPTHCPILLAGEYMRIIPPDCEESPSEYHSQCFYECNCGFQLRGNSSRTCQTDGTWSDPAVESTCIDIEPPVFITCPLDISLPTDLHQNFATNPANWDQPEARDNSGRLIVEASPSVMPDRFLLDQVTVITFTARDKAGLESVCTFSVTVKDKEAPMIIKCPDSIEVNTENSPPVVRWEEPVFEDNSGSNVSVIFNRRSGSTFFLGQPERVWYIAQDQSGNTKRCEFNVSAVKDQSAPIITCPLSIVKEAEPGLSSAEVTWDIPTFSDNALTVTVQPRGLHPPHRFEIGSVVITYTGTNASGLSTECYFKVVVQDTQPPVVENCPEDDIYITSPELINAVSWEEPQFADNSKEDLNLTQSHEPGVELTWGSHIITYTATDAAGMKTECQFRIRVGPTKCPHHPDPRNGVRACDQWLFGTFCRVYCNQAFEFAEKPAPWYICGKGLWTTNPSGFSIPWPDCSERHQPDGARLGMETQYYAGSGTNRTTQRTIQSAFVDDFRRSMFGRAGGCMAENSCLVDDVTVYSGEIDEDV